MSNTGKVIGRDPMAYAAPYTAGASASKEKRAENIKLAKKRARIFVMEELMRKRQKPPESESEPETSDP